MIADISGPNGHYIGQWEALFRLLWTGLLVAVVLFLRWMARRRGIWEDGGEPALRDDEPLAAIGQPGPGEPSDALALEPAQPEHLLPSPEKAVIKAEPPVLASDDERDLAARALSEGIAEGRLSLEEGGDRIGAAYQARFRHQLLKLTADLPERGRLRPGAGDVKPATHRLLVVTAAMAVMLALLFQAVAGIWGLWPVALLVLVSAIPAARNPLRRLGRPDPRLTAAGQLRQRVDS